MSSLKLQKRLASDVMKCGKKKVKILVLKFANVNHDDKTLHPEIL